MWTHIVDSCGASCRRAGLSSHFYTSYTIYKSLATHRYVHSSDLIVIARLSQRNVLGKQSGCGRQRAIEVNLTHKQLIIIEKFFIENQLF